MWSPQTCAVCLLSALQVVHSLPDFRHRTDFRVDPFAKGTFAEYYLKDESGFTPIEFVVKPDDLNFFPKCCPPGFAYRVWQHSCIEHRHAPSESWRFLTANVNLVKSGLADCEVIVDHVVQLDDVDVDDDTRAVSFGDERIEFGGYCLDVALGLTYSKHVVRECRKKEYCSSKHDHDVCIRKCCPDGYQYVDKKCARNPSNGIDLSRYRHMVDDDKGSFAVYHQPTTCRKYMLGDEDGFSITSEGGLLITTNKTSAKYAIDEEMYCIDSNLVTLKDTAFPVFLLCVQNDGDHFKLSRTVLLISCICLLLTVVVFVVISKVRTLMGKIVTTYSITMFVAFLLLLTVQFQPAMDTACKPVGYSILFAFTATFAWMNVMCYEIWKTLGVMRSGVPIEEQRKIFLKYNIYAWTVPTILVLLTTFFNTFRVLPDEVHPFLGETHCILENRVSQNMYGHTVFMVLPQAVMLSINGFFFVCTLRHFWSIRHEESEFENDENAQAKRKRMKIQKYDVERFAMVTKLFIIMGLSWVFEVISAVIDFKQHPIWAAIEQVFDTFNCLQGVLIFCVFILNKATIQRLFRRCSSKNKADNDNEAKFSSIASSVFSAEQQEMTSPTS